MGGKPKFRKARWRRPLLIGTTLSTAITFLVVVALAVPASAAINPVTGDATGAAALVTALAAPGFPVGSPSFDAVPPSGTPNAVVDSPLSSFPTVGNTFAVMSTGDATIAGNPNDSSSSGANIAGPNVRGDTDFDVSVLKIPFTVPSSANCLTFDFQFYSEEYPEFVNSQYNDAFIAELDTSNWTTSGSAITAPNNFAFDPNHQVISINAAGNTSMSAANATGTTYDGATPKLSASVPAPPGAHTLYLSIFDQGDHILDSAAFLDGLSLGFVPNPSAQCVPGATPFDLTLSPATATNPTGTSHTVTATLSQGGSPLAGKAVKFSVTGANATTGTSSTGSNGQATFTYTGNAAGKDDIVACFDETNNGDCEATATATKTWTTGDPTPPSCQLTSVVTGPPKAIKVTVQDTGSGLASITVVTHNNADVTFPAFSPGDKTAVVVTGAKINQTLASQVALQVKDVNGNTTDCDPVLATLTGTHKAVSAGGLAAAEHFVRITNAKHGLRAVHVIVNGRRFVVHVASGHSRLLNVASAMRRGSHNRVRLVGVGSGSADVLVWDGTGR
jgi:hypothetical protein